MKSQKRNKSIILKGQRGRAKRPRISIYRSRKHIYAQLIDDEKMHTILSVSDKEIDNDKKSKLKPTEVARLVGEQLAMKANKLSVKKAIFDRRSYKYHGRVKALAEGARTGGLSI